MSKESVECADCGCCVGFLTEGSALSGAMCCARCNDGDVAPSVPVVVEKRERPDRLPKKNVAPRVSGGQAFTALAKATRSMCMDHVLPSGRRLGGANREMVVTARTVYESQSKHDAARARWMNLIAQSLQPKETVLSRLTEARLTELREESKRG